MGTKVDDNLPINLGFAGFRLCFPVNAPHVWDEVVAFLGASYFRFLGRGQRYGLSARGLAVGGGLRLNEEFPYFREFWIETPDPAAERIVICALLDGEFGDRAFRFDLVPGQQTYIETSVTLFARKAVPALGAGAALLDVLRRQSIATPSAAKRDCGFGLSISWSARPDQARSADERRD